MAALTRDQQQEAASLYLSGLSVQQVADNFGISLNAAFYALRKQDIPRRSISESNRIRFENKPLSYKIKTGLSPEEHELKLAAIMLYWAEGYKVGKMNTVDFANSDPAMVVIFRRFLLEICGVDETRLRFHLYCYPDQDIESLHKFWSELLNIPLSQFVKPYISKTTSPGVRGSRMIHGLAHIVYCDRKLLRQILSWIDEYSQKCVGGGVVNRDWL
jgi:hypothetical protein